MGQSPLLLTQIFFWRERIRAAKSNFTRLHGFDTLRVMLKKILLLSILPLLLCGCAATFTNLTPRQQVRNANGLYPVEVAFNSRQQTLRWDSIKAQIVVGSEVYEMHKTMLMSNRWEGLIPAHPGLNTVTYQYKFDFLQNEFGPPKPNSARSKKFTLRIVE
jgi:hypothetical protein